MPEALVGGVACTLRSARSEARTMICNEGTADRWIRIALGVALLSLVFMGPRTWLGLIGLVPLLTGLAGYCPLYQLLGFRTCRVEA